MAGDTEALAQGVATGVVGEISQQAYWSAIFAMIAGLKIFVGRLANLVHLRTFTCHVTTTQVLKTRMK
ncbi:hypothetical protein CDL12_07114 [Handroanthus impetiginosus]|uniref:Uncharacterized protein n=1 Tax=Handroanthus impetiginosus TaxID=429701 RepID=A0A2G9HRR6_9LAMI|nr:hypothetical protein CDL12_07114 [Handroanthus impetiginosus]